jgi:ribonuclease HI
MNDSTIFTAELLGILKALKSEETVPNAGIITSTDSLSSIQSIEEIYSNGNLSQMLSHIKYALYDLRETNNVTLFWTPAHCGIEGNEQADEAAKESVEKLDESNMEKTPSNLIGEVSR